MNRTHYCGELRETHISQSVCLAGWVHARRDHGGVIFIDLRDARGIAQVVFNPDQQALFAEAERLRSEYVIEVRGMVRARPAGSENPNIPTGAVEMVVSECAVLNTSRALPFELDQFARVSEDVRLRYRYLDLRRERLQKTLRLRHRLCEIARATLNRHAFTEIETPFLTKSTPEGARDFLVPCRLTPGSFYALPQSPQLFKQLLMVAGYDRYYQIARCFRDEDLRADRQPEFTQIDLEMSFIEEQDIQSLIEELMRAVFKELRGIDLPEVFPRLPYDEAMQRFGTDRPDQRFGLEITDLGDRLKNCGFKVFSAALAAGGIVRGLRVAGGARFSRMEIDKFTAFANQHGAKGLAWMKHTDKGLESSIIKFFSPDDLAFIRQAFGSAPGDILFFAADTPKVAVSVLGALRSHLIGYLKLTPSQDWHISWVVDFPLLEWSAEERRWFAMHHPFTAPRAKDEEALTHFTADPTNAAASAALAGVRARAYDLVVNGVELGGGSIRIHRRALQEVVFAALRLPPEETAARFGFLLEALAFGAPPHGGIALGLDRLVAMLAGEDSIRDTIAFPKTQKGSCLLTNAPDTVSPRQLAELHLALNIPKKQ